MKYQNIIVAGGRNFCDYVLLSSTLDTLRQNLNDDEEIIIVSGCARGADSLGIKYAEEHGLTVKYFPADWKSYGRGAGFVRNEQMLRVAQGVVAFWDGQSKGTAHMIRIAEHDGVPVLVVKY